MCVQDYLLQYYKKAFAFVVNTNKLIVKPREYKLNSLALNSRLGL